MPKQLHNPYHPIIKEIEEYNFLSDAIDTAEGRFNYLSGAYCIEEKS